MDSDHSKYVDKIIEEQLNYILNDLLEFEKKKIYVKETKEKLTLPELLEKVKLRNMDSYTYQKVLESFLINDFFDSMKRVREELKFLLTKKLLNLDELAHINKQLEEENQKLVKQLEKAEAKIEKLEQSLMDTKEYFKKIEKLFKKEESPALKENNDF